MVNGAKEAVGLHSGQSLNGLAELGALPNGLSHNPHL
jgi:hypothetical protein